MVGGTVIQKISIMQSRPIFSLLFLMLVGAADTQPSTEPASTQPSDAVSALIAQLDAPEFDLREVAQQKLADMGPGIEPRLQQALNLNPSDEARTRLNNLIGHLEESKLLHASITMHYSSAPLKQVLDDFAAQAGTDLGLGDPSVTNYIQGRSASIDLDNAGFWPALRAIDDASGLEPSIGQNGLTLATGPGRQMFQLDFDSQYATVAGGLLIVPRYCQYMRMYNYSINRGSAMMNLVLDIAPEPKMHVRSVLGADWVKECVDDKGNSLMPLRDGHQRLMGQRMIGMPMMIPSGPRQWVWTLATPLRDVPGLGTKIARLRGELDFVVQTRSQSFEIPDITRARNTTATDGLINITVLSCSRMNQNYRLDLECVGPNINPGDPSVQDFLGSAQLIDDQGQAVPLQSWSPQVRAPRPGAAPMALEIMAIFQPTQNMPVKLRWEKTLDQKRLSVPFELDNLPLQ
jgi:hypothetical protein